ncbi:MAG: CpaD family pilus assembly protein [Parvibaculum sp.]
MMRNLILTVSLSMALAACGGFNGREDALFDARYSHPIAVDPQVVTMDIDAGPEKVALTVADKAAIDAFVVSFKARGHGLLSISAPDGSPNERNAVGLVAEIRAKVKEAGLSESALGYAAYRASSANSTAPVMLSYRRFVASATPCGNWTQDYAFNPNNERSPNFGCSTQNNLAAIVADPADLIGPRTSDPAYAPRRDQILDNYRTGELTESERSENASGVSSEVLE